MNSHNKLSEREVEVALVASRGYSIKYMAKFFTLSTRTIETHIRHINEKLGIKTRDELIELRLNDKLLAHGIRHPESRSRMNGN